MAEKSTTNDPIEDLRAFMMETADSYAFHPWTAEDKHIRHDDIVDTPDRQTHYNWTPIRTPRGEEPAWHGWAVRGAHGELIKNYGVPYFWGGHAALDPSRDFMYSGELTFDDVLAEGWGGKDDAGDISTVDNLTIRWRNGSGVDCSGFVAQVWRLGNYFNTGGVKDLSLPIRFVDLEAGDLLFKGRHVMLFKEFSTPEKAIPGVTRIKVYESAVYCARVTMSEYLLTKVEEAEAYMKTWNGFENIPSDKVKLKRIATYYRSEDNRIDLEVLTSEDPNWAFAHGYPVQELIFYPRAYTRPAYVVLVIDCSGSMGQEHRIEDAKAAANLFVDLLQPGDRIGIVPFSCRVPVPQYLDCKVGPSQVFPLEAIGQPGSGSTTRLDAHTFISDLVADPEGYTSIGSGLLKGLELLSEIRDPLRVMVLLSDGKENRFPHATDELLDQIRGNNIQVLTVGFGINADDAAVALMERIARQTWGDFRFAESEDLQSIFSVILSRFYVTDVLQTASGTVSSGGMAEQRVSVDSTIGSATFSLFWRGSELDLTLVQPDGSIIGPSVAESDPKVSFTSGGTYQFYKIYNPQAGEWTMRIFGRSTPADGEAYSISVSAMSSMKASIKFDKAEYFAGDPVKIEARIEDTVGDSAEPGYVLGAIIKVTVDDPYLSQHAFDLYDDGLHGDGEANDGVYANTFANTPFIGNYDFKIQISGASNRDGQPFTREYAFSHVLTDPTLRFPNTPVLDEFNRKNGKIGRSWSGAKSGYRIVDQQVGVRKGGPIYWKPGILAAAQQAFFTLAHVDPAGLEQGLLLKVQDKENHRGNWRRGAISVFYNARESKVGIKSCMPHQKWQTLATFDAKLQDGDRLGGRAEADGKVRAYLNSAEIGSVDAGSFFAGKGGRIGMWFIDADASVLDDFGGGGAVTVPVIQGTDDAGLHPDDCGYWTNQNEIYFGRCRDGSPIVSGFRFQNVPLPPRATIVEAHLDFTVDGPFANEISLQFFGERSANPATFSDTDRPSDRQMTAAIVPWAISATYVWNFNVGRRTPAVTAIVQELVNLPRWASGNAMVIIVRADPAVAGDVSRRVYAWERDASAAARLVVTYTIESLARGDDDEEEDDDRDDDDDDHHDDDR